MLYAIIENGIVVNILDILNGETPGENYIPIEPYVSVGWSYENNVFSAPLSIRVREYLATKEEERIASLWQAAHDYEYTQISGSAIGLITMGVLQGLPKCIAVQNWIKSVWSIYYERKATGSTDTNFNVVGQCPHSVPELMAELGI